MSFLSFLLQYLRKPRSVGAIMPSSPALVEAMLNPVDWSQAKVIVEFGPGTGVMTKGILARMRPDATLIAYEINDEFLQQLTVIKDSRFTLKNKSAETLDVRAEVIISSLPLLAFSHVLRKSILRNAATKLHREGIYVQFQYSSKLESVLKRFFPNIKRTWVAQNLPPAFVYACRKTP